MFHFQHPDNVSLASGSIRLSTISNADSVSLSSNLVTFDSSQGGIGGSRPGSSASATAAATRVGNTNQLEK
jgi:hypothetical protein